MRVPLSIPGGFSGYSGLFACLVLSACSTGMPTTSAMLDIFSPYKVEIVQGNVVTREQVQILRPGFSRNQVKDVLGTPMVSSLFHANRWDYTFTIKRAGAEPQIRNISVYFENDLMQRVIADELPLEAEFTASINTRPKGGGVVPKLQATPDELQPYKPAPNPVQNTAISPAAPVMQNYPPLEPIVR
jgi:outer membrane protein assembly factor BamE